MRIEWLNQKRKDRVIIFFNGWGMDAAAVSHLTTECDVMMCCDYRSLNPDQQGFPEPGVYRKIYVVAWSMGVWAAANVLSRMQLEPSLLIGLNGTEYPVNDQWGIPSRVYELTEKGMSESGRDKFLQRMLDGKEELQRFECNKPVREIGEVCEELARIREQSTGMQNHLKWDRVYISGKDVIFPVQNQLNWWQDRAVCCRMLAGGHYPFYQFRTWEEVVGEGER